MSVFLKVAYDGAPFHGFARQPGLPTVQGALEDALAVAMRRPVETVGAGRTDSGVHALGQAVSFPAAHEEVGDLDALVRSLDGLTPKPISVVEARLARADADARFSATARAYRYRISAGGPSPALCRALVWRRSRPLDVEAMRAGAVHLLGEHDFRSFCVTPSGAGRRTVRSIDQLAVVEEEVAGEPVISVTVEGRSFLHSMVRIIVGTLADVGTGAREPDDMARALAARERSAAGQTAPAKGLVLEAVSYPEDVWL